LGRKLADRSGGKLAGINTEYKSWKTEVYRIKEWNADWLLQAIDPRLFLEEEKEKKITRK